MSEQPIYVPALVDGKLTDGVIPTTVVKTTGSQTIAGAKDFSTRPKVNGVNVALAGEGGGSGSSLNPRGALSGLVGQSLAVGDGYTYGGFGYVVLTPHTAASTPDVSKAKVYGPDPALAIALTWGSTSVTIAGAGKQTTITGLTVVDIDGGGEDPDTDPVYEDRWDPTTLPGSGSWPNVVSGHAPLTFGGPGSSSVISGWYHSDNAAVDGDLHADTALEPGAGEHVFAAKLRDVRVDNPPSTTGGTTLLSIVDDDGTTLVGVVLGYNGLTGAPGADATWEWRLILDGAVHAVTPVTQKTTDQLNNPAAPVVGGLPWPGWEGVLNVALVLRPDGGSGGPSQVYIGGVPITALNFSAADLASATALSFTPHGAASTRGWKDIRGGAWALGQTTEQSAAIRTAVAAL